LNKIREVLIPPTHDERAFLAAQRIAIFGYDPCAEIHSNRIVQEGGTSDGATDVNGFLNSLASNSGAGLLGIAADPGAWVVKSYEMSWPEYRDVEIGVGQYRVDRSIDGGVTWTEFGTSSVADSSRASDQPGIIAARAAKSAKPAPDPVFSVAGAQTGEFFSNDELLEALTLIRAKRAPAVKETPRGLMIVREFDHRLGLWGEEGC